MEQNLQSSSTGPHVDIQGTQNVFDWEALGGFLESRATYSDNLADLFVELREYPAPTRQHSQNVAKALAQMELLRSLSIQHNDPLNNPEQPMPLIHYSDIHVLNTLRLLERLHLNGFHVLISPENARAVHSWPNLFELNFLPTRRMEILCNVYDGSCPVELTIADAHALAMSCPKLVVLCVDFHARGCKLDALVGSVPQTQVEVLQMQPHGCDGCSVDEVEQLVHALFPRAKIEYH